MILTVHSDALYLSVTKARSKSGSYIYLRDDIEDPPKQWTHSQCMQNNDICHGVGVKGINRGIFINAQDAVHEGTNITEIGHPQPTKIIQKENTTSDAFANKTLKQKQSKAIDMLFYWMQERCAQRLFFWNIKSNQLW